MFNYYSLQQQVKRLVKIMRVNFEMPYTVYFILFIWASALSTEIITINCPVGLSSAWPSAQTSVDFQIWGHMRNVKLKIRTLNIFLMVTIMSKTEPSPWMSWRHPFWFVARFI